MAEVAAALRQLVEAERASTALTEALAAADGDVRRDPRAALHAVVAHVQRLFDIKSLDGVVPRMTQARHHQASGILPHKLRTFPVASLSAE